MKTVHIGSRLRVCSTRIKLLRAEINYTHVDFFDQTSEVVSTTLKVLEDRLPSEDFVRINRKFMVNRQFIKRYRITEDKDYIELHDGSSISPSRRGRRGLRAFFASQLN